MEKGKPAPKALSMLWRGHGQRAGHRGESSISPCLADIDENLNWRFTLKLPPTPAQKLAESKDLLAAGLNLKQVAQACGYSTGGNFVAAFHKLYGLAPRAWLEEKGYRLSEDDKLREAERLIREGYSRNLETIALAAGYVSRVAMKGAFYRVHGMSAGAWRKKIIDE